MCIDLQTTDFQVPNNSAIASWRGGDNPPECTLSICTICSSRRATQPEMMGIFNV